MSAPLFFVSSLAEEVVALSLEDSRHALRSLRLGPGEELILSDGRDMVGEGRLVGERDGRAVLRVSNRRRVPPPSPRVSVAMAAPKGDRLGWAVQKLGELGVDELVLLHTERSVRRFPEERVKRSLERLAAVAREASMQSRRPTLMEVAGPVGIDRAIGGGPAILLWEAEAPRLSQVLPEAPRSVRLLVGPEGGFTEEEARAACQAGGSAASLGPAILRTETAAVVGAALVLARYGRLG